MHRLDRSFMFMLCEDNENVGLITDLFDPDDMAEFGKPCHDRNI